MFEEKEGGYGPEFQKFSESIQGRDDAIQEKVMKGKQLAFTFRKIIRGKNVSLKVFKSILEETF